MNLVGKNTRAAFGASGGRDEADLAWKNVTRVSKYSLWGSSFAKQEPRRVEGRASGREIVLLANAGDTAAISVVRSTRSVSEIEMVLMRSCRRVHRRERAAIEAHRGLPSDCFPASDAPYFASSQTPQDRSFRNIRRLLPLSRNEW